MTRSLVNRELLARTAFELLASSSLDRYAAMAKRAAASSLIPALVRSEPESLPRVIRRANVLWAELLKSGQRDVPEFELAIILCVLAPTGDMRARDFLTALSLADRGNATWISALARRLRQENPSNRFLRFGPNC